MPHFVGKDLSALPVLYHLHYINDIDEQKTILDIVNIFDTAAVKASKARIDAVIQKQKKKPK